MSDYQKINALTIDKWNQEDWEWGRPITHEAYVKALNNEYSMVLTPTKVVPKDWYCELKGAKVLGLASGGAQQMPIFAARGAICTILDYSQSQLDSERMVAERGNYSIEIIQADMCKKLPFNDESFDLIFHPVSNCYIEDVAPVWQECYRVLKPNGILLAGLDNGINYIFDESEMTLKHKLPFNPLKDAALMEDSIKNNWGIQFSHTIEEQIGAQLKAGFMLCDIYQDTNGEGNLHDHNVPTYYATKAIKVK